MTAMSKYAIRQYGDPVLRQRAADVDAIDGTLKQLADDMAQTMYEAPGVGWPRPRSVCRSACSSTTSVTERARSRW